jgi:hypothetical protein
MERLLWMSSGSSLWMAPGIPPGCGRLAFHKGKRPECLLIQDLVAERRGLGGVPPHPRLPIEFLFDGGIACAD